MKASLGMGAVLFLALVIWAAGESSFLDVHNLITKQAWFIVTLVDLYFGFFIMGIFIFWIEKSFFKFLLWLGGICILGNMLTAVYVLYRFNYIKTKLREK